MLEYRYDSTLNSIQITDDSKSEIELLVKLPDKLPEGFEANIFVMGFVQDLKQKYPKLEQELVTLYENVIYAKFRAAIKKYAALFKKAAYNYARECLYTPSFYCDGTVYHSIDEIQFDKNINSYLKKVCSMKFSDETKLHVKNPMFYAKLCYAFECHLDNVKSAYLECKGYNSKTDEPFECKMNLEYRTSERYKKRNVARSYALIDEMKNMDDKDRKVTLVTFTSFQKDDAGKGIQYLKQYQDLIKYTQKLHDVIRKDYQKVPYMHVVESHKSGYIHIHRVYGCSIDPVHQEKYKKLWESYGIGSYENGLHFSYNDEDKYESKKKYDKEYKPYESAFLYQIKYISKSISEQGSYPFHQLLSDAIIWYCSKRQMTDYKGIRTFLHIPCMECIN